MMNRRRRDESSSLPMKEWSNGEYLKVSKKRGPFRRVERILHSVVATGMIVSLYSGARSLEASPPKKENFPRVVQIEMTSSSAKVSEWKSKSANIGGGDSSMGGRRIKRPMASDQYLEDLLDSKDYGKSLVEPLEIDDCVAQYEWQISMRVDCNSIHEIDLANPMVPTMGEKGEAYRVGGGYWRDVWAIPNGARREQQIFKTIRYTHEITPRNLDRHRRDAVAMERLVSSPHVVDIYGFCGNTGIFEFASGGDLAAAMFPKKKEDQQSKSSRNRLTKIQKLRIAAQIAKGLADVHNSDREGRAAMAHVDISPGQYVLVDGVFKLNDFNRARFLAWNQRKDEMCKYYVGNNPGKNRSPEEYAYEGQTEMVDVYSLGNIFFSLLQDEMPFRGVKAKNVYEKVKAGERPAIYRDLWESKDPVDQVLKEVMMASQAQNYKERSSARELQHVLEAKLKELDPSWKLTDPFDAKEP